MAEARQGSAGRLSPRVIFWGGTGQAKVMRPIVEDCGSRLVAVFDDTIDLLPPFQDVPIYYGWRGFQEWIAKEKRDDHFSYALDRPSRSEILAAAVRQLQKDLEDVRKLTHNA